MLALAFVAITQVQFHFVASEFSNAVYHVGCLTSRLPCTNSVFDKFWNEEYHVNQTDAAHLNEFKEIMGRVENAAPAPLPAPFPANYLAFYPSLRLRSKVMAAALESNSGKGFISRSSTVLSKDDRQRIGNIFDYFTRRLHPWWLSTGKQIANSKLKDMRLQMKKAKGEALASEMAAFLESTFSSKDVYLHAIPSPSPKSSEATANPVDNHFCMEVTDETEGTGAASIALHELVHSFYDAAPLKRHMELMDQFLASPEPAAQSFYEFLNEAIATGAQLLLMELSGVKDDDDPYHDPYIPRLGKSVVPILKQALAKRQTLFGGFANDYLTAGAAALGPDSRSAHFWLQSAGILTSEANRSLERSFRNEIHPRYTVNTLAEVNQFPNLNIVRLETYNEVAPDPVALEELELKSRRGFIYLMQRGTKAKIFLIAGRTQATVEEMIKALANVKEMPPEGLVIAFE